MGPTNPAFGNGKDRRRIRFTIFPQGASTTPYTLAAGTLIGDVGWVESAARVGAGTYRVVLTTGARRAFVVTQLHSSIVADAFSRVALVANERDIADNNLNISIDIAAIVAAAATDLAAGADSRIHIDVELEFAT